MKNILALTLLAMVAFAGNSIIVRMALASDSIGPLSFGVIRILAGAVVLALLVSPKQAVSSGSWQGALCLLTYVVFFSYAYLSLDAGTGALILFATVQIVMIGWGIKQGERLSAVQWSGTGIACLGLVFLLRPGAASPDPLGALMMAMAGLGWALYSLLGRHVESPTLATAGNFVKAFMLVLLISVPLSLIKPEQYPHVKGVVLAIISGGVTSGLGYALWYRVLRYLPATRAGIAQLSVPAIAAVGGLMLLNEAVTLRSAASKVPGRGASRPPIAFRTGTTARSSSAFSATSAEGYPSVLQLLKCYHQLQQGLVGCVPTEPRPTMEEESQGQSQQAASFQTKLKLRPHQRAWSRSQRHRFSRHQRHW